MNQLEAFRQTILLAGGRRMFHKGPDLPNENGWHHVAGMLARVETAAGEGKPFSPAKLGRWLGWAQASLTALGLMTLEEAKKINEACSKDEDNTIVLDRAKLRDFIKGAVKASDTLVDGIIRNLEA